MDVAVHFVRSSFHPSPTIPHSDPESLLATSDHPIPPGQICTQAFLRHPLQLSIVKIPTRLHLLKHHQFPDHVPLPILNEARASWPKASEHHQPQSFSNERRGISELHRFL
jgi:hypothetical protein